MKTLYRILSILVTVILPFFLIMTAVRLLITPLFLQFEYNTPGFPPDSYGFTKADRLHWSRYAVDYLVNDAGIEYIGDLKLPDGQPLYNQRELSHMVDVKNLVQAMIRAWWLFLALLVGLGLWAWRGRWQGIYWWGVAGGGWATIGLIVVILAGVVTGFEGLFTAFHRIFFTGDTWIFEWSDTLIRLFPLRFWRDGFILMGVVTIGGALLAIVFGGRLSRRTS